MILLYFFMALFMCLIDWLLIRRDDEKPQELGWSRKAAMAGVLYLAAAAWIAWRCDDIVEGMLYIMLFAYLAAASYSDYFTMMVYRFFVYPALFAGVVHGIYAAPGAGGWISFGIYLTLQLVIFRRYFGWADTLAFVIGGLFFLGRVESVLLCGLFHMGISLLAVAVVHLKEIDWVRGRLPEPVAFLPYIAVGMVCITGYWSMG